MEQVFSYKVEHFTGKTKRYCQTLKLKNDSECIRKYVELHSKEKHWKEIREKLTSVLDGACNSPCRRSSVLPSGFISLRLRAPSSGLNTSHTDHLNGYGEC